MADPGTGEGQGSRGGRLLDHVIPPKENYTPEQRQVYDAAREALKPFEDSYHQEAADFKKRPLPPGVTRNWLRNEYTLEIKTESGKPVKSKVRIGSIGNNPIMRELQIGPNKVIFGEDGTIQEIVLVNYSALPRVTEVRESVLGVHGGKASDGAWFNDSVTIYIKSPTEMQLIVSHSDKPKAIKPAFGVQEDGSFEQIGRAIWGSLPENLSFPQILKGAMEAINPANN